MITNQTNNKTNNSTILNQKPSSEFDVTSKHGSMLVNREVTGQEEIYNNTIERISVNSSLRMDYSGLIDKPFYLTQFAWTTTSAAGAVISTIGLPSAILALNRIASAPFDLSSIYRMRGCVNLQVAGTPMHGGVLVAAVLDRNTNSSLNDNVLHTYQSAPHAFLHANNTSAICIEIPFYSQTRYRYTPSLTSGRDPLLISTATTDNAGDFAQLRTRVLAALTTPTAGATSVVVTVSVIFKELEFYVPKAVNAQAFPAVPVTQLVLPTPTFSTVVNSLRLSSCVLGCVCHASPGPILLEPQSGVGVAVTGLFDTLASAGKTITSEGIDTVRGWVRDFTGLHNPNERGIHKRVIVAPTNNPNVVDSKTLYLPLDPYSNYNTVVADNMWETTKDEGLISNIIQKPMAVSKFAISTSTVAQTLLFSAPISPFMFRNAGPPPGPPRVSAPIQKFAYLSRFYSGDLELLIQHCGSSFHMFKLLVVMEYYASHEMATTVPVFRQVLNNPSEILEFSSGGQIHNVTLTQNSIFDLIPVGGDTQSNALTHGRVSVFLLQPLVTNGSVSVSCDVVIHMRAKKNFQFYGYAADSLSSLSATPNRVDAHFYDNTPLYDLTTKQSLKASSSSLTHTQTSNLKGVYTIKAPSNEIQYSGYPSILPLHKVGPIWALKTQFKIVLKNDKPLSLSYLGNSCLVIVHQHFYSFKLPGVDKGREGDYICSDPKQLILYPLEIGGGIRYCAFPSDYNIPNHNPLYVREIQAQSQLCTPTNVCDPLPLTTIEDEVGTRPHDHIARPIVHVRDHLRRVNTYYNVTFSSVDVVNYKGVFWFSLSDLLNTNNTTTFLTPYAVMCSMFSGYRGGFKVRLRILGASSATVYFQPPGVSIDYSGPTGNGAWRYNGSLPVGIDAAVNTTLLTRLTQTSPTPNFAVGRSVFPRLDTVQWSQSGSSSSTYYLEGPAQPLGEQCAIEFEIPYMSILRYVNLQTVSDASYATALGNIIIATNPKNLPSTTTPSPISITVAAGASDSGSLCFQTRSDPLTVQAIGSFTDGSNPGTTVDNVATYAAVSAFYTGAAAV
jgi:hypothetical protein